MKSPPVLDETKLSKVSSNSPVDPNFLGYTPASWLSLMDREGPVFRTEFRGEPACVIGGHEADITAWKSPDSWIYGPPSSGGEFFLSELGDMHVTQLDGEAHRRSRRLILPAFGASAVTRDVEVVAEVVRSGMEAWPDSMVDFHPAFSTLIAQALNVSQLKESISAAEVDQLVTFEEGFIPASALDPEARKSWYETKAYSDAKQASFAYFERVVTQRLGGVKRGDSLDLIIERAVPDGLSPLSHDELVRAVYLLCVAGVGNIANILCAALWALGENPVWKQKLRDELNDFEPGMLRQGVSALPNLKAVISEVERCYLPAPVIPKMSAKAIEFLGFEIPGQTHILQLHGLAHFQEDRYPQPFEFKPERWFKADTLRGNAFGGGPHLCLGMGVTRFYVPLLLAQFIKLYDWDSQTQPAYVSQVPALDQSPLTTCYEGLVTLAS